MDKQQITEKDSVHKQWYEDAKTLRTLDDFDAFFKHLTDDYTHDYGTICHALAAAAVGAATITNRSPAGGITGFQAGAVMWEFIQHWTNPGNDGPLRLISYGDMLYPQHDEKFEKTIRADTWQWLQEQAREKLAKDNEHTHEAVLAHWQSIANGIVPFGFTLKEP